MIREALSAARVRVPLWLASLLAVGAFVLGSWAIRSCSGPPPEVTGSQLVEKGFHAPEGSKPKIPDLPPGSKPVATLTGRIEPLRRVPPPGPVPTTSTSSPQPGADSASETPVTESLPAPWPTASDLGGSCDCQLARTGQTVFGRVFWSGELQGRDGERLLTRGPLLAQEVHLAVEPGMAPVSRIAFLPRRPRDWRLGMSCGVGLGYDPIRSAPVATAACLWGVQF